MPGQEKLIVLSNFELAQSSRRSGLTEVIGIRCKHAPAIYEQGASIIGNRHCGDWVEMGSYSLRAHTCVSRCPAPSDPVTACLDRMGRPPLPSPPKIVRFYPLFFGVVGLPYARRCYALPGRALSTSAYSPAVPCEKHGCICNHLTGSHRQTNNDLVT